MATAVRFFGGFLIFIVALVVFYWRSIPYQWRTAISVIVAASGLAMIFYGFTLKAHTLVNTEAYFFGQAYDASQEVHAGYLPFLVFGLGLIVIASAGYCSEWFRRFEFSDHLLSAPAGLSLVFIVWRILLEKSGAPNPLSAMIGIVWLPPAIGVFLGFELADRKRRVGELVRHLATYAWIARVPVAALMVAFSFLHLGSHLDISAITKISSPFGELTFAMNTFRHHFDLIFLPQLIFWPLYTIVTGWFFGGLVFAFTPRRQRP